MTHQAIGLLLAAALLAWFAAVCWTAGEVDGYRKGHGDLLDGDRLIYCVYPDCGCDGERLCMAENGASDRSRKFNVEGMYRTKDGRARMRALGDIVSGEGKK